MKKIFRHALPVGAGILFLISCSKFEGGTLKSMQDDFDKLRLRRIEYDFQIMNDYREATGKYPFAGEADSLPIIIVLQDEEQEKSHEGRYPFIFDLDTRSDMVGSQSAPPRIIQRTESELASEINSKLGRNCEFKHDPQKFPVKKPCVFIYVVYKNTIDISCYLHNKSPFTREMGPYFNKFAITSSGKSFPKYGIWSQKDLPGQSDYQQFKNAKLNR